MATSGDDGSPHWAAGCGGVFQLCWGAGRWSAGGLQRPPRMPAHSEGSRCSQKDGRSRGPEIPSNTEHSADRLGTEGSGGLGSSADGQPGQPGADSSHEGPRGRGPPSPLPAKAEMRPGNRKLGQKVDSGRENSTEASLLSLFTARAGSAAVSPGHMWKFTGTALVGPGLVSHRSTRSRRLACGGCGGPAGRGQSTGAPGGLGPGPTQKGHQQRMDGEQEPTAQGRCISSRKDTRGSFPGSRTTETKRLNQLYTGINPNATSPPLCGHSLGGWEQSNWGKPLTMRPSGGLQGWSQAWELTFVMNFKWAAPLE